MEPTHPDTHTGLDLGLDPRAKALLAGMAGLYCLVVSSLPALANLYGALLLWMLPFSAGRAYGRWLLLVLPMALFFGAVTAWAFGAAAGITAAMKLLSLMTVGFVFFFSTPPEDLANALVQSGLPYTVAFVVGAGMQFVPVLGAKARAVLEAQQARGLPVCFGWRALRHYPAFLLPLLVQSFQLADELAEAMETRGFGRKGRSFYKEFRFRLRDWVVLASGLAAAVLLVLGGAR